MGSSRNISQFDAFKVGGDAWHFNRLLLNINSERVSFRTPNAPSKAMSRAATEIRNAAHVVTNIREPAT